MGNETIAAIPASKHVSFQASILVIQTPTRAVGLFSVISLSGTGRWGPARCWKKRWVQRVPPQRDSGGPPPRGSLAPPACVFTMPHVPRLQALLVSSCFCQNSPAGRPGKSTRTSPCYFLQPHMNLLLSFFFFFKFNFLKKSKRNKEKRVQASSSVSRRRREGHLASGPVRPSRLLWQTGGPRTKHIFSSFESHNETGLPYWLRGNAAM